MNKEEQGGPQGPPFEVGTVADPTCNPDRVNRMPGDYSSCFGLRSAAIHKNPTSPKNTIPIKIRFSIALPLTVRSGARYAATT